MVSRLEDLCGIQMAIELANELELKKQILRLPDFDLDDSLWYDELDMCFEDMEKIASDALEKFPFGLRRKIPIPVAIFCLTQSIEWAKFHEEEFHLPFDYSCSFLRSSFYTSKGILNKEKAARELLKDTELNPSLKFCIACHYCFSDVIPVLWEQLPEDKRPKIKNKAFENGFSIGGRNEMADIWSYSLLGELQIIMKGRNDSFSLYKFKKTFDNVSSRNCSDVAFKKCFEELNEFEKEEAVIFTNCKLRAKLTFGRDKCVTPFLFPLQLLLPFQKYIEMAIFLLRNVDEWQLYEFFEPVILHYVLFNLLSWPYQHLFMNVVSQFWEVLPKTLFWLLQQILSLIQNKWSSKLCDYCNILREFWIQSCPSLKRFFFHLERVNKIEMLRVFTYEEREDYCYSASFFDFEHFDNYYLIIELFESPFTIEYEKIIRLIFSSATLEEKSDIVRLQGNEIWNISFKKACDLGRIDLFIECCVPKGRIESFKKELFNDNERKKALFNLVLHNKGKEFQNILNWAFSAEEVKEWLKNFLLLYVRQKWKHTLYFSKKVKYIDKSLEWALSSNEIENFKKSLALDVGSIAWTYEDSILDGDFQDIDFFLEWIFSSEIERVKFKKDFAFEMVPGMNENFLINGLSSLKKLIEWSALSEEECKDFKRQVAFSDEVIEYYSNLVAKRQLNKANTFIQWAELTEMEVKNFIKLFDTDYNILIVRKKRELESFSLQINSTETKKSRHC
ncbi:UNVERIFIED_CONTAM: hypothetical protein RMT77_018808 [Armadillidium vulgare]